VTQYPHLIAEIDKWAYIVIGQFKVWLSLHPQRISKFTEVLREQSFRVPYTLPSGRTIILRGKYDSIVLLKAKGLLRVEDHKTKGYLDEEGTAATLFGNLQMMLYHTAARASLVSTGDHPGIYNLDNIGEAELPRVKSPYKLDGTIFNVVRRPLAEKSPIRQRKSETEIQFYDRVIKDCKERPHYYFKTMNAPIGESQMKKFQRTMLDPILESLCDWWEWIQHDPFDPWSPRYADSVEGPSHNSIHWQTPWGMFNSMFGGFRGDYYELLTRGTDRNLIRVPSLFPELNHATESES
jgi:hypothetical protein